MEVKYERRAIPKSATIIKRDEGGDTLDGYGAVFYDPSDPGTAYMIHEDLEEHIDSAAFNRALAEKHPCRCLVNHDPNYRLGRADKGTLRLSIDKAGLKYSCDLPDTQVGRDTCCDLKNGNLDGSSFSFSVTGQRWEDIKRADGSYMTIRTITDVDLWDVGPVAFPAYQATTAGIRSTERAEDIVAQRDAWRRAEAERVQVRLRVIEVSEMLA